METLLSHFSLFSFKDEYWRCNAQERKNIISEWTESVTKIADKVYFYQVYPSRFEFDIMLWCNNIMKDFATPDELFKSFARQTNNYRKFINITQSFWGLTRPSVYTKVKSAQEIDPFDESRKPYFIIYPFTKTTDWYLLSRESRQGMMNGHIKLGKEFPDISQLLLYSFGLQDQEFIVSYETQSLALFSDLVNQLRNTDARKFTLKDTPVITCMHRTMKEITEVMA